MDLLFSWQYLLSNREYPGFQDYGQKIGNPNDKENFAVLIKELHDAFQQKGYVLSAAVAAEKYKIDIAYDVPSLSKYLNFINLMTYDFHGSWVNETGANAPLHPKANDAKINQELTVEFAVNYWLMKGADPKKIVSLFWYYIKNRVAFKISTIITSTTKHRQVKTSTGLKRRQIKMSTVQNIDN